MAGAAYVLVEYLGRDVPTHGPSMRPTIAPNESVEIDTGAYEDSEPAIGDIVALQAPSGLRSEGCGVSHPDGSPCPSAEPGYDTIRLIKRIVAGPGDRVAFTRTGHLVLNGRVQEEPYIIECPGTCGLPEAVTIPDGHFFVAGDNRPASSDSRYWGSVPADSIDGMVELTRD